MAKKKIITNAMRMLNAAKIPFEAIEYDGEGLLDGDGFGSAVAELTGVPSESSYKTLVARGEKNGIMVCCIPVDEECDLKKLAKACGDKKVELTHVKELLSLTGYIRGGVSPIGMKKKYPTYIDESCLEFKKIAVSAGVCGCTLLMKPDDVIKNTIFNNQFDVKMGTPFTHYPWSDGVKDMFENRYSQKWSAYLAGLWFNIDGVSEDGRYKYMDYISDQYRRNFCNTLSDWCHSHGVEYIGHIIEDNNVHALTCAGPGHYFRALDGQDMSGIDVVLHQIVPGLTECSNAGYVSYKHMNNNFFHYYLGKLASSFAHIDEKKKGRAMCEIFGAYGWAEGTKIMKYLMDHMLVRGINYYVPHAFSPKLNDPDCPPNFYDSGRNPQYKYFKKNMDYLNRMSHILSDGLHHSTCAILYDAENRWINSDFLPVEKIGKALYDNLLDYDIIPTDYLTKIDENSCINGEKYNLLLVPWAETIPDEIITKLKECNAKVVLVCEKDYKHQSFECIRLDNLPDYMRNNGCYDIVADYDGIYLRAFHYERNNAHIYMFSNEDINNEIKTSITSKFFSGGSYIIYNAFENTAVYRESTNGEIAVELQPYNSIIVMFGDVSFDGVKKDLPIYIDFIEKLECKFDISIARGNSTDFVPYSKTDCLESITSSKHIPDFSGHIRYETQIELEESDGLMLDLGYVGEVAELYVNNKLVGTKLFPPYTFDISDYAVNGVNKITIIISNHNGYERRDDFSKFLLFEPSGLLGPIMIKNYKDRCETTLLNGCPEALENSQPV